MTRAASLGGTWRDSQTKPEWACRRLFSVLAGRASALASWGIRPAGTSSAMAEIDGTSMLLARMRPWLSVISPRGATDSKVR